MVLDNRLNEYKTECSKRLTDLYDCLIPVQSEMSFHSSGIDIELCQYYCSLSMLESTRRPLGRNASCSYYQLTFA